MTDHTVPPTPPSTPPSTPKPGPDPQPGRHDGRHDSPRHDAITLALEALGERDRAEAPHGLADRIAAATAHAPPLRLAQADDPVPARGVANSAGGIRVARPHAVSRLVAAGGGLAAAAALTLLALPLLRTNGSTASATSGDERAEVAQIEAELETFLELDDWLETDGRLASADLEGSGPDSVAGHTSDDRWADDGWIETWLEMDELLAGASR